MSLSFAPLLRSPPWLRWLLLVAFGLLCGPVWTSKKAMWQS